MNNTLILNKEIDFPASKESIWNLLTNPEMTRQYMFGCEVLSEWKQGSSITWKGKSENGKEVTYVKGEIIEILKGEKVTFSMLDPNMGIEDVPENYVNLTYNLEKSEDSTRLRLIQGDFATVENGKKRYEEAIKGWEMVFPLMEKIITDQITKSENKRVL
ncbi:SRPBCC domain-containing protein [Xanthovirga aplysinae]|uniref:SRPBCC domain-containing protein n=1 Tax=Xanthovirga aplysinae TaxID=2529853 RepID=UPI0012BC415C|nr:SRPBCC domain-containing protein [Xanthovirga aplysinae]MTI30280.1 hypothetical protein [Xanthovirga aplysinae]